MLAVNFDVKDFDGAVTARVAKDFAGALTEVS
jgi:hypothetical protein